MAGNPQLVQSAASALPLWITRSLFPLRSKSIVSSAPQSGLIDPRPPPALRVSRLHLKPVKTRPATPDPASPGASALAARPQPCPPLLPHDVVLTSPKHRYI